MSYPDLGCFAECLECELCERGLDDDIDLWPDDIDMGPDLTGGVPPDDEEENWFDDFDPDLYPVGGFTDGGFWGGIGGKW